MSTMHSNYWTILGVVPGADDASIKRAFRKQARLWHPDLNNNNPESEERFKQINEAYAVLSDQKRRFEWEQSCSENSSYTQSIDFFYSGFPSFESYSRLMLRHFNRKGPEYFPQTDYPKSSSNYATSRQFTTMEDRLIVIDLTPNEAIHGSLIEVELEDENIVNIETPSLAGDGWLLKISSTENKSKDQFLQLRVLTEEGLSVDGLAVRYQLELFPVDAALGCTVYIPTLLGYTNLQVPSCSSSGDVLLLKGEGFRKGNRKGDQLIEIKIIMPMQIHQIERFLYTRLSFM